jgi:hypothetical protein
MNWLFRVLFHGWLWKTSEEKMRFHLDEVAEYRTPTGRLCPYAGMTDEELDDFEYDAEHLFR